MPPSSTDAARPQGEPEPRRGSILDRTGRVLVSDALCLDVWLRYEILAARVDPEAEKTQAAYLLKAATRRSLEAYGMKGTPEELLQTFQGEVDATWALLEEVTGASADELSRRCGRVVARVAKLKAAVRRTHGKDRELAEERDFHFLARAQGQAACDRLEASFKETPWVRLKPSSARHSEDPVALVHVVGQLGRADARRVAAEGPPSDPARALREGDRCGISGAERLGDAALRPWVDASGNPHPGSDVTLTLDAALQRRVYQILEKAVKKSQAPCGGAAVVLDVSTGDVLALVSYPGHAYDLSLAESHKLLDDSRWTPMRFRAVSSQFPPGSTLKPHTLYTSLAEAAVTTATRIPCTGRFKAEIPDSFRCWVYNRSGTTHGVETAETALRDSCNIYFYTAGDKLGAKVQVDSLARMGVGVTQGTGLLEESAGVLPTPEWLASHRKSAPRYQRSDAWNYAFGQGELTVTPLQMANLAATLARGRFEPVTLMRQDASRIGAPLEPGPALDERWLSTVRRGLWRVVNEKGGTADMARLGSRQAVLCGKTGSAQAVPRPVSRRFDFVLPDGKKVSIEAPTPESARAAAPKEARLSGQTVLRRFPAVGVDELPSHAWFIGYTQDPKTPRGGRPDGRCYALSVLIEYGGAGGAVAGPVARDIARCLFPAGETKRRVK